ncbi:MAG TPA: ClpX C4-type zinc finger protein [Pyrinomonadaceae bacterium]|jgi:ATP-dependent protease Clp ATPase subunit
MKFRRLSCSFCGKKETEVAKLVAGPRVYICDACVAIANRLMSDDPGGGEPTVAPTVWNKIADSMRRFFHQRRVASLMATK